MPSPTFKRTFFSVSAAVPTAIAKYSSFFSPSTISSDQFSGRKYSAILSMMVCRMESKSREQRKMSLEDISLSTKIATRHLQALEADKFDQLPGGIFNKGFVRAYAHHLGLDEDQTITEYLEASGEGPAPEPEAAVESKIATAEARGQPAHRPLPWGLFAAILLMVALALWFWNRSKHNNEGHPEQSSAPAATSKPVPHASTGDATMAPPN